MIAWRVLLLTALLASACSPRARMDGGVLGPLTVRAPHGQPVGLVFLLPDARGRSTPMTRTARKLRDRGLIVVEVDTATVLANLDQAHEACHQLTDAFETVSQAIQKQAALKVYLLPVLAGVGEGATLALAALWQAGPETIAGVATVDFEPSLSTAVPLCADPPARRTANASAFRYPAPRNLFGWWHASWTSSPGQSVRQFAEQAGAFIATSDKEGSGDAFRVLTKLLDRSGRQGLRTAQAAVKLGDLPVIDLPGRRGGGEIAIIFSGDGGWRDLDRSLGEILAGAGVRVIGIDCLRYFWSEKSPEAVATDLQELIGALVAQTRDARIALVGFSFGADLLPAVFNRLSPQARDPIQVLSLLAPGQDAHFVIHVEGWLGGDPQEDATPIGPDLARIDGGRVQCIYGEDEADESGCLSPQLKGAEVIGIPGGHHFDEDYESLAQRILERLRAAS